MGMKLTGNGCAGGACLNPTCKALGTAAPVGDYPEIGFEQQSQYIPNDVVIPTFDDASDGAIDGTDPSQTTDFMTYSIRT